MRYGSRVLLQGRSRRFVSYHASKRLRTSSGEGSPTDPTHAGLPTSVNRTERSDPPAVRSNLKQGCFSLLCPRTECGAPLHLKISPVSRLQNRRSNAAIEIPTSSEKDSIRASIRRYRLGVSD